MRLLTRKQAQSVDRLAVTEYGLTNSVLMENAGSAVISEIEAFFPAKNLKKENTPPRRSTLSRSKSSGLPPSSRRKILREDSKLILCAIGPGNNGADGWVVARRWALGHPHDQVVCFVLCEPELPPPVSDLSTAEAKQLHDRNSGGGALWFKKKAEALVAGVSVSPFTEELLPDLVVDGLFGTGLCRDLSPTAQQWIQWINDLPRSVQKVSIDIPSGLDCDRGEIWGAAVRADLTVTMGLAKPGLLLNWGPRHVGLLKICPIGFPEELLRQQSSTCFAVGPQTAARWIPPRPQHSNKSSFGRLVLCAGSAKYPGAGVLASRAALRTGVGYLYHCGVSGRISRGASGGASGHELPEVIPVEGSLRSLPILSSLSPSSPTSAVSHSADSLSPTSPSAVSLPTFVVGPGWDVPRAQMEETLSYLATQQKYSSVVLDAEALNFISAEPERWRPLLPPTWLLTPHPGEMARLIGWTTEQVVQNRSEAVREGVRLWGCRILLKGFRTIVAEGDRQVIILAGNSALAKAGSGDVLAGMIGSFGAQGLDLFRAALLGANLHGYIAKRWVELGKDPASLNPSDLIEEIPLRLRELREEWKKSCSS